MRPPQQKQGGAQSNRTAKSRVLTGGFFVLCLSTLACNYSEAEQRSEILNRPDSRAFSVPERSDDEKYVYFIALGDQGKGGEPQRHVANLMNEKARQDSLDFVITLGDNFYSRGVSSVHDKQWRTKFEEMYDLPYLQVPFYASLGNHDHRGGNAMHQIAYTRKGGKWQMPHYFYTFHKKISATASIQFFALDTEIIKKGDRSSRDQLSWLEKELSASTATWKVVYGHHPVYSYGKHGDEKRLIQNLRPVLEKHEVDAYICGHDHDRQLLGPEGGVHYIVSGTGSKSRDTRYGAKTLFAQTNLGFAWFRVSPESFHLQFINDRGEVEFAFTWHKNRTEEEGLSVRQGAMVTY